MCVCVCVIHLECFLWCPGWWVVFRTGHVFFFPSKMQKAYKSITGNRKQSTGTAIATRFGEGGRECVWQTITGISLFLLQQRTILISRRGPYLDDLVVNGHTQDYLVKCTTWRLQSASVMHGLRLYNGVTCAERNQEPYERCLSFGSHIKYFPRP